MNTFLLGWHVGTFRYGFNTVVDHGARFSLTDFILGCTGQCQIGFDLPGSGVGKEVCTEFFGILFDPASALAFEVCQIGEPFFINAMFVVHKAAGVGESDSFAAEVIDLLDCILDDVA
jgi:hypothetical protein